jgi:hypothetical protein
MTVRPLIVNPTGPVTTDKKVDRVVAPTAVVATDPVATVAA